MIIISLLFYFNYLAASHTRQVTRVKLEDGIGRARGRPDRHVLQQIFVEKDGIAHSRTIRIGVIEADRVQITAGLAAGERLIVKGQADVEDGMKVEVR